MNRSRGLLWIVLGASAALLAGCACGPAPEPGPPARRVIATPNAPAAVGPYSQGIQVGDFLYVSGQLGIDPATGELAPGGVEPEARRALDNVKAIVEAAGLALADVVQCQVFLADIRDYAAFNAIYATYFSKDPPARALVQPAALPRGGRVEVMVVAVGRR